MGREMTEQEVREFLLARPARTGKLATVREDGRPHVVPIWYDLDGEALVFSTWHESVKAMNLQSNPLVALCVDEETPPFSYVLIEGEATFEENPPDMKYWATRIAARYMGEELADSYGQRNAVPGEWLVRIRPTNIVSEKDVAA